jgi:hypothetical protein
MNKGIKTIVRVATVLAMLIGTPVGLSAQTASPPQGENSAGQPPEPMPEMAPHGGQGMGTMHSMGAMQPMSCMCPSALRGAGGIVLLALGTLVAGSAAAALIALTVFLVRRSRRAPAS